METLKKIWKVFKTVVFPASNVTTASLAAVFAGTGAWVGSLVCVAVNIVCNAIYLGYKLFGKE